MSNVTEVKLSPSHSANDNINYVVVFIFKTLFFYVHDDSILFECILTGVQEIAGKDTVLLVLACVETNWGNEAVVALILNFE